MSCNSYVYVCVCVNRVVPLINVRGDKIEKGFHLSVTFMSHFTEIRQIIQLIEVWNEHLNFISHLGKIYSWRLAFIFIFLSFFYIPILYFFIGQNLLMASIKILCTWQEFFVWLSKNTRQETRSKNKTLLLMFEPQDKRPEEPTTRGDGDREREVDRLCHKVWKL